MATARYVPNELLSRLVGDRMYSVEFVLNDYVQLRFDGPPAGGPIILNCYVWPIIQQLAAYGMSRTSATRMLYAV